MTEDAKLIERLRRRLMIRDLFERDLALLNEAADRIASLSDAREALLSENARLVGIIDFMTAANAMQADSRTALTKAPGA